MQAIKADKRRLNEKLIPLKKEAQFPLESCTFNVIAFPELYRDYKLCEARIGLTHKKVRPQTRWPDFCVPLSF